MSNYTKETHSFMSLDQRQYSQICLHQFPISQSVTSSHTLY